MTKPTSHWSPVLPHFSPTPSAKVPASASRRDFATQGNEGPGGELLTPTGHWASTLSSLHYAEWRCCQPHTRRAVACHCLQSPSKLTSLRCKELIVFHALCRLTKHTLMMSTQTDSLAPQLGYCFYSAIWVEEVLCSKGHLYIWWFLISPQ